MLANIIANKINRHYPFGVAFVHRIDDFSGILHCIGEFDVILVVIV
jgi:hypothetical protein